MIDVAGRLLVAMPALTDPNFTRSVIHVIEHDDATGTVGVVINRPSRMEVAEHLPGVAEAVVPPSVVFIGGPVEREIALTMVREGDVVALAPEPAADRPCRVFSGYSGWGAGQLAAEIAEGAWHVAEGAPDDVFTMRPERLWSDLWRRQSGPLRMLATFPIDPRYN